MVGIILEIENKVTNIETYICCRYPIHRDLITPEFNLFTIFSTNENKSINEAEVLVQMNMLHVCIAG